MSLCSQCCCCCCCCCCTDSIFRPANIRSREPNQSISICGGHNIASLEEYAVLEVEVAHLICRTDSLVDSSSPPHQVRHVSELGALGAATNNSHSGPKWGSERDRWWFQRPPTDCILQPSNPLDLSCSCRNSSSQQQEYEPEWKRCLLSSQMEHWMCWCYINLILLFV